MERRNLDRQEFRFGIIEQGQRPLIGIDDRSLQIMDENGIARILKKVAILGITGFQGVGCHGQFALEVFPIVVERLPGAVGRPFAPALFMDGLQFSNPLQQCFAARLFTHSGLACRHGMVIREYLPDRSYYNPPP